LIAGDPVSSDMTEPVTTDKVVYRPGDYSSSALGVITNPYDRDLNDLRVSAVAYNAAGEIIGGG
jgi:hypothetical protein